MHTSYKMQCIKNLANFYVVVEPIARLKYLHIKPAIWWYTVDNSNLKSTLDIVCLI